MIWFLGGKKKPLKQGKKSSKELDEVSPENLIKLFKINILGLLKVYYWNHIFIS